MPVMHDRAVKIRRGRRTDLPMLLALLEPEAPIVTDKMQVRHWRRLAGDPGLDFYVAEHNGAIQGALLVCYVRALRAQGWRAILDMVFARSSACVLGQELLDFAKARARKRGCRQMVAWRNEAVAYGHFAELTAGGFLPAGEVLSCDL